MSKGLVENNRNSDQIQREVQREKDSCSSTFQLVSKDKVYLVIGDSNAQRDHFKDPDVKNVSASGAKAGDIERLLEKAVAAADQKSVKRIAIHLGKNDITKN